MAPKTAKNPKGAGRSQGSSNEIAPLSRVRAHEIIQTGNAPLDIMLRNMWFWDEHAANLQEQITETMQSMARDGATDEQLEKAKKLLGGFLSAREKAQSCAVDAAPYVHPRLQSIQVKRDGKKVIEVNASIAPPKTSGEDRSYRVGYGNVISIDGDKKRA